MRADLAIAVTGATSLQGRKMRDLLAASRIEVERVSLLELVSAEAILSEYGGEAVLVGGLVPEALEERDLVFLCGSPGQSRECLGWKRKPGALFVDLSGVSSRSGGTPVVSAAINPRSLTPTPATVCAPHPISCALTTALAPLDRRYGIERLEAIVLRPVSDFGEEGVEELHRQTVGLLNFTDLPKRIFGRQIAFNLLPQSVLDGVEGEANLESRVASEVDRILGWEPARCALRTLIAPVFHGHEILIHVGFRSRFEERGLKKVFAETPGLKVSSGRGGRATPVEVEDEPQVRIVDVAPDGVDPGGWWFTIVGSDLAGLAAKNALEIARLVLSG